MDVATWVIALSGLVVLTGTVVSVVQTGRRLALEEGSSPPHHDLDELKAKLKDLELELNVLKRDHADLDERLVRWQSRESSRDHRARQKHDKEELLEAVAQADGNSHSRGARPRRRGRRRTT